jgi:selenocysteine-specific elongation factor
MRVIGTAGHVDHGKTTLVESLTGINPDRLQEEQARQMTIDLGFAWLTLPDGESVGIIDVPGHRDFIENMLAGVGGIDAAILVVAADEGVMPQTREHLAILDLLEVERAVVALTKADLIHDPAWIELVCDDVRGLLAGTRLEGAAIVPVSARTGAGLQELITALAEILRVLPTRSDLGRPRLSIDRAFTMSGFGTIVTGTLLDGRLSIGQEIEVLPSGLGARIRGLQTHRTKIEEAVPGSRVAVNVTGVEVSQLNRGDVLALPGTYRTTSRVDVSFRLLREAEDSLRHNQTVKLFLGAAQRIARVRVLGADAISPGGRGWLQLEVDSPLVGVRGDHFILRRPSPGETLGGGRVADPAPAWRHRRRDPRVIERLERLLQGTPGQVLLQALIRLGPMPLDRAMEAAGVGEDALKELNEQGALVKLGDASVSPEGPLWIADRETWNGLTSRLKGILTGYHRENPLRQGMPREELKSRSGLESRAFSVVVGHAQREGLLEEAGSSVRLAGFAPRLTSRQKELVDHLLARFEASPFAPPSVKECVEAASEDVVSYLVDSGKLIQLSPEVVFTNETYQEMIRRIRQEFARRETLTVAQIRDLFGTSRKYVLALMEHLDETGVTQREGDIRRLSGANSPR